MVADPCQIVFGQLKTHDLNLSRDSLTSSPWLKKGDNLNVDRGFLDHLLMRDFNEKGVSVTVPTKKNMEIYKEAVAIAIKENDWGIHPNPKRKKQKIQLVKDLAPFYQGDPAKEESDGIWRQEICICSNTVHWYKAHSKRNHRKLWNKMAMWRGLSSAEGILKTEYLHNYKVRRDSSGNDMLYHCIRIMRTV